MVRAAALALLALSGSWLAAQEENPYAPPVVRPSSEGASSQDEVRELFRSIERRMEEIDALLADAGSGRTESLARVGDSGLGDLVLRSQTASRRTVQDIDRLLELVQQHTCSSGGS